MSTSDGQTHLESPRKTNQW